jgi:hypothetical protein
MRRQRPLLVAAAALAAIVVLFVVLRPEGDNEETGTAETTGSTQVTTSATASTAPTTTAKPAVPARRRVTIAVRAGRVIGGIRRATVPRGALVELLVTADVADEVHLHGYDISRDVAPGAPARLRFKATTSGRFEVELEKRQLQIAEITVRP